MGQLVGDLVVGKSVSWWVSGRSSVGRWSVGWWSVDLQNPKNIYSQRMLQMLSIALIQVKAGYTSENLQNLIRQFIYSLYRATKITKKENQNMINSIMV